jgi:D-alanine--poly(phosphoribitol) ligase subunit 2
MPTDDEILTLLARVAETPEVKRNLDLQLFDTGVLDSLRTVELIVALSTEMSVEISPAEFDRDQCATPRMLVAYVKSKLNGQPAP